MSSTNPYAPPKAELIDAPLPGEAAPALWNPAATASWSLFLTPIFGALLQMKNWQALGRPEKAARSKAWAIASAVILAVIVFLPVFGDDSKAADGLGRLAGFALLITWYYANGKEQRAYVLARFGKTYPRRSWWKPFGWAALVYVGIFVTAMLAALVTR